MAWQLRQGENPGETRNRMVVHEEEDVEEAWNEADEKPKEGYGIPAVLREGYGILAAPKVVCGLAPIVVAWGAENRL